MLASFLRLSVLSSSPDSSFTSLMWPLYGMIPESTRRRVVLPDPFGPSIPQIPPSLNSAEKPDIIGFSLLYPADTFSKEIFILSPAFLKEYYNKKWCSDQGGNGTDWNLTR